MKKGSIEEKNGKLNLDFFETEMVIDAKKPGRAIRQLVRMIKVLELRLDALERKRARRS